MKLSKTAALTLCAALSLTCLSFTACSSKVQAAETASTTETAASADAKAGDHKPGENGDHKDLLQSLVESGKLSQTTYDAIQKYMKENAPEMKDGQKADGQTPPEKKDGQNPPEKKDGQNPPAKPDGDKTNAGGSGKGQGPDGHGMPGGMINSEMLQKLLDASVITQDEYNTIKDAIPQPPEKPAEGETASAS